MSTVGDELKAALAPGGTAEQAEVAKARLVGHLEQAEIDAVSQNPATASAAKAIDAAVSVLTSPEVTAALALIPEPAGAIVREGVTALVVADRAIAPFGL